MINKFIFPLLAILLLGSCANKFSLVKRKYSKGYYLGISKNNSSKKSATEKVATINTKKISTVIQNDNTRNEELKTSDFYKMIAAEPGSSPLTKSLQLKKQNKPLLASVKKDEGKQDLSIKLLATKIINNKPGKASADANLIILVILCFLWWLNLIAVYIHDGKKITLNFWITLLLDFTFIGGVIFSLLVVLDVVDLA